MSIEITVLKRDKESKAALSKIFDSENIKACAQYGAGDHCNSERVEKKIELWGKRGEDETNPLKCHIIAKDGDAAAMLNIGVTGNPPTVIDRRDAQSDGKVLELSGVMVRDKYSLDTQVHGAVHDVLSQYRAHGFSKVFLSFKPNHVQQEILEKSGAVQLTGENSEYQLGNHSLHPERFKFEGNQLLECSKWDDAVVPIQHEDWHDSQPCITWFTKTAMVFDVIGGAMEYPGEL